MLCAIFFPGPTRYMTHEQTRLVGVIIKKKDKSNIFLGTSNRKVQREILKSGKVLLNKLKLFQT
jgi:hypothetical protein